MILTQFKQMYNLHLRPSFKKNLRLKITEDGNVLLNCSTCKQGEMLYEHEQLPTYKILDIKCDCCGLTEQILIRNAVNNGFMLKLGENIEYYSVLDNKSLVYLGGYKNYFK